jgi:hypothetical protein
MPQTPAVSVSILVAMDAAADGDRTHVQDTVLQINFNSVDHPQVQSYNYCILNSFTEQTLLPTKQEFFSPMCM